MPPTSSPFVSEGNRIAANALFDSVKQSRSIALIGAGLSISAGYPSWENLLMLLEAGVRRTSPFYNSALLSLRNSHDPLWRAQELRRYLGEDRYFSLLRDIFRPCGQPVSMVDGLLKLPFRHYLTTNFDPLLEESSYRNSMPATTIDWANDSDVSEFLFRLQDPTFGKCVVHLHGRYNDPAHIVLTDHDYTGRYYAASGASQKLISIFATQPVVFVGFSLTDPALIYLLRQAKLALGTGAIRHFAILGLATWNDTDESIERYRLTSLYGVEPVFYPVESDHSALSVLIDFLNKPTKDGGWIMPDDGDGEPAPSTDAGVKGISSIAPAPAASQAEADPQRGKWGGTAINKELQASALIAESVEKQSPTSRTSDPNTSLAPKLFDVTIWVVPQPAATRSLHGRVRFHLHPMFAPDAKDVRARSNQATLRLKAPGPFTVGIEVFDEPYTLLELDLGTCPGWS